jgi:thiamine phosphate synthase YjbQ (UPF0047 family)
MVGLNVITKYISLSPQGENDIVDITDNIKKMIRESQFKNGIIHCL